jgi:hypothetical protein
LQKLHLATVVFSFVDPMANAEPREIKRTTLVELVAYCDNARGAFAEPRAFRDAIGMVAANIFRALPHYEEPPVRVCGWVAYSLYMACLRVMRSFQDLPCTPSLSLFALSPCTRESPMRRMSPLWTRNGRI